MGKDWLWLGGMVLLIGIAMSIAAYSLGSGTTTVALLSVALIALALGQVIALMRGQLAQGAVEKLGESQSAVVDTVNRVANESRRINAENVNLARNVEQFQLDSAELNKNLVEGLSSLRHSHETVAESLKSIMNAQQEIKTSLTSRADHTALQNAIAREQQWMEQLREPAQTVAQQASEPENIPQQNLEQSGLADALNLSLEPIVDLFTSSTAHYRMVLGMTNDQGMDVEHDVFVHHAERLGLRAELDQHVIEHAMELLVQLRQRDEALSIFVPIGAATLASPQTVQNIISMLQHNSQLAPGIVLDFPHAVLASLSEASLEGLATFARSGVQLSLSQASISGIDLSSLNSLNVRWIGLAASSIGLGQQISAGLPGFIQSARALRIQVIVSHVGDPRHVQGLARTARYASGPAFAMPRKLKRTEPQISGYSEAA